MTYGKTWQISEDDLFKAVSIYRTFDTSRGNGLVDFIPEILQKLTGAPLKVCYSKVDWAVAKNILDYGTTERSGWWADQDEYEARLKELKNTEWWCQIVLEYG